MFFHFSCGSAGKESACNGGDLGSIPGSGRSPGEGKIPWRKERLYSPVFCPGEFHGLYSPWGWTESDMSNSFSPSKSLLGFLGGSDHKESTYNEETRVWSLGWEDTILLLFYVLVFWLWGMLNLSSLTRNPIRTPRIGRWSLTIGPPGKAPGPMVKKACLPVESIEWQW